MPDLPILIFPAAIVAERQSLTPNRSKPPARPSKGSQGRRLAARFEALGSDFGVAQATPEGVDPEQVIVLETMGSVADFQNVVKKIAGMEWLGDFDAEVVADDPGFFSDGTDLGLQRARLFVLASNRTAYNEVLRLWNTWQEAANDKLPRGYGALAEAFKYLNDVRAWGPQDRVLATGVAAYWERGLAANDPSIRFEVELWCRSDATKRSAAFDRLSGIVTAAGGQCVTQATLPEIDYHGVLVELPAPEVRKAVNAISAGSDTKLLRLTDIKYFAPIGQASISQINDGEAITPVNRPVPQGDPVVAILDGLPLTNHAALQGRLVVDDPDDIAALYQVGEHRHGTAMASLVAHDEYDSNEVALRSKIYFRPVMAPGRPDFNDRRWETFPPNQLAIDLIHRAVRRMFEPEGTTPPQAPNVKAINLSLGDRSQPFDRAISPWARLLDWLAFRYQVLFVVSSGNHADDLTIPLPSDSIKDTSDADLRAHTLRAMAKQRVSRRLLAPAESVNALTVGALHAQSAPDGNTAQLVDLLRGAPLVSPIATVANGFRRSVKPEILVPGGRSHYSPRLRPGAATDTEFQISSAKAQPGQLVAACHPAGTSNQHAVRACGSSNAAALTTRRAAQLVERLRELQGAPGGSILTDSRMAVVLKAMLVHGASWGDRNSLLDQIFGGNEVGLKRWWRVKRACAEFLGYGAADFDRGTICSDQRVIALGVGELQADEGHIYQVPLPSALSAQTVMRRLAITLAWFTPINPRHRSYRVADLWFDPPLTHLSVTRTETDHDAVTRGTVQHEVLEGSNAVPINDGDTMPIQVNCRREATSRNNVAVPYALLVSIETAEPLAASIYAQMKAKIDPLHARLRTRPATGASRRPR
jgi:hypothetical protein